MKRLVSLCLSMFIIISAFFFSSCSGKKTNLLKEDSLSFRSEQEMFDAVQGVWLYEYENSEGDLFKDFLIFKEKEIFAFGTKDFEYALGEILADKIKKGEDPSIIEYKNIVETLEKKVFEESIKEDTTDYYKGEMTFSRGYLYKIDRSIDQAIQITKDGIKYKKYDYGSFDDENDYYLFKKIETSSTLNSKTFEDLFRITKEKHIISPGLFLPNTGTAYAKLLDVKDWVLYSEGDGEKSTIYLKNGDSNSGALIYSNSLCTFTWGSNKKNFVVYRADEKKLIIQANDCFGEYYDSFSYLYHYVYHYVDLMLGNYPYKLSGHELFEMFENEGKVSGGVKSLDKVIDRIEYEIDKSVTAKSGVIQVTWNCEY